MAHGLCAVCHADRWAKKNPEKVKAFQKRYQRRLVTDPEKRAMNLARKRKYQLQFKQRVIDKLGGCCARCGTKDIRVLQIDHINGYEGGRRENSLRLDILADRVPLDNFQVLCANDHMIKTHYDNMEVIDA
jgi:5-methylcytosine-specific restriction endonuclease McrA